MRSDRVLIAGGGVCLLVGASTALAGSSSFPLATLGLLAVGAVLLVIGLERARSRGDGPRDPARGDRLARVVFTIDAMLASPRSAPRPSSPSVTREDMPCSICSPG